jgi:phospholipase C
VRRTVASAAAFVMVGLGLVATSGAPAAPIDGIHNIQHVVVIMQENRSFDQYFGTYPGANGIPAEVCEPDPLNGGCVAPLHDPSNKNYGGPHGAGAFTADLDRGKLDGFIGQAETGRKCKSTEPGCSPCTERGSSTKCIDVMGYHDARAIPNYWSYAQNFVLQDSMYEPNSSWSWPEHLFQVSAWSATCTNWSDPMSCISALEGPLNPEKKNSEFYKEHSLPWTDVTYLLHKYGVSWAYYVFQLRRLALGMASGCGLAGRSFWFHIGLGLIRYRAGGRGGTGPTGAFPRGASAASLLWRS